MDASDPFLLPAVESKALREFPCGHPSRKGERIVVACKGLRSVEARRCRHCGSVWHLPRRTGKPLGWLSPDAGAMESLETFPGRQARLEALRHILASFARGVVLAVFGAVAFVGVGTGAWLLDRPQPRAVVLPQAPTKAEADAARARLAAGQAERLRKAERRVDDVSWRLSKAAAGTCRKSRPRAGFSMAGVKDGSAEPELAAVYGTGPWRLFHVVSGSPAHKAGLRSGDVLTSAGKRRAAPGDDVDSASDAVSDEVEAAEAEGRAAFFTYLRDGKEKAASFLPARTCAVPVVLDFDDAANAYYQRTGDGDDGRVVVHIGMLRVASDDDMLAAAIGHELAHSLQDGSRHEIGLAGKILARGVLSIVGFSWSDERAAWAADDEREADVVGLRLAAMAGFDPIKGAEIYGRLASATDPMDLAGEGNHPSAVDRDVYVRREAEALAGKLRRGESIGPGRRPAA